jgi:hypothetical protein
MHIVSAFLSVCITGCPNFLKNRIFVHRSIDSNFPGNPPTIPELSLGRQQGVNRNWAWLQDNWEWWSRCRQWVSLDEFIEQKAESCEDAILDFGFWILAAKRHRRRKKVREKEKMLKPETGEG